MFFCVSVSVYLPSKAFKGVSFHVKDHTLNSSGADIPAIAPPLEPIGWPVANGGSAPGRNGPAMPYKSVVRASMERLVLASKIFWFM